MQHNQFQITNYEYGALASQRAENMYSFSPNLKGFGDEMI
jgi:hypothetical protein